MDQRTQWLYSGIVETMALLRCPEFKAVIQTLSKSLTLSKLLPSLAVLNDFFKYKLFFIEIV